MDFDKIFESEMAQYVKTKPLNESANQLLQQLFKVHLKQINDSDMIGLVNGLIYTDANIKKQYEKLQKQLEGKERNVREQEIVKWLEPIIKKVLSDNVDLIYKVLFKSNVIKRAISKAI